MNFILNKSVHHLGGLDYILPVPVSEDIKDIHVEEWERLLHQIINQSIYDTIIMDIDEGIRDVYDLLELCDEIHLMQDDTSYALAKMKQFERELTLLGHEDILSKTHYERVTMLGWN